MPRNNGPGPGLVRLYQGRVALVVADPPASPPASLDDLWAHHELFQDAINYYLVALAALAPKD